MRPWPVLHAFLVVNPEIFWRMPRAGKKSGSLSFRYKRQVNFLENATCGRSLEVSVLDIKGRLIYISYDNEPGFAEVRNSLNTL